MRKVLLLLALCACSPSLWQPLRGQSPTVRKNSSGNKKQQTALTERQPYADQQGTKNAPIVVDVISPPKSEIETAQDKKTADRKDFIDTWTLRLAFLGAIFTAILAGIGYCGVRAANRTLREIKRQADVMEKQTTVLEKQAIALINSERAWIIISHVHVHDLFAFMVADSGGFNHFRFDIINKGRTVAKLIECRTTHSLLSRGTRLPPKPAYPGQPLEGLLPSHGSALVPEESLKEMSHMITEMIDHPTLEQINTGEMILSVRGFIRYFDFAEVERRLQFCYRYVGGWKDDPPSWQIYGPLDYNTHT